MKKYKKGFTLSEVLICLTIVGVIMAFSVPTLKVLRASYTSTTYFVFNNINAMVEELIAGKDVSGDDFIQDSNIADSSNMPRTATLYCKANSVGSVKLILNPDVNLDSNTILYDQSCQDIKGEFKPVFCTKLAEMVNTSGQVHCGKDDLFDVGLDTNDVPYIKTKNSDEDSGNFTNEVPNFRTTNGQKYYISNRVVNSKISDIYGFRLMGVDLNGNSKPNISDQAISRKAPDVVTFLIMDSGEVFPLGAAADNLLEKKDGKLTGRIVQYINSKVKGYYFDDEYGTVNKNYYHGSREDAAVPENCYVKGKENIQLCNYSRVFLKNPNEVPVEEGREVKESSFFSYRQAYCTVLGADTDIVPSYKKYCDGIERSQYCPPSTNAKKFDLCVVENVKPMFRYNLN